MRILFSTRINITRQSIKQRITCFERERKRERERERERLSQRERERERNQQREKEREKAIDRRLISPASQEGGTMGEVGLPVGALVKTKKPVLIRIGECWFINVNLLCVCF